MKSNFARMSILVLGAAAAAFAQTPNIVKADVPFEFTVAATTMPAGHYVIYAGAAALSLHAVDIGKNAMVQGIGARSLDSQKESRLVFHRYGDQYFLYQVWTAGLNAGREVPPSKRERSLAKGPT